MSRNYMRYLHVLPCDHLTSWQEPHMAHGAIMMPDQKSFQTTNCSLQIAAKRGKTTPLRMTDTSRINPRFVYSKLSKVTPPASTRLFGTWHWLPPPVKRTTISTSPRQLLLGVTSRKAELYQYRLQFLPHTAFCMLYENTYSETLIYGPSRLYICGSMDDVDRCNQWLWLRLSGCGAIHPILRQSWIRIREAF